MEHLGINSSNYFLYWRWWHECPPGGPVCCAHHELSSANTPATDRIRIW